MPGRSLVSGDFTRETFPQMMGNAMTASGGTFREEVVELEATTIADLSSLITVSVGSGSDYEYRTVHVWEIRNGRCSGWREEPGHLAAFGRVWAAS